VQMDTNFFGPLTLMQSVIPNMRERRSGAIVNISSALALNAIPAHGAYSASKFALEGEPSINLWCDGYEGRLTHEFFDRPL